MLAAGEFIFANLNIFVSCIMVSANRNVWFSFMMLYLAELRLQRFSHSKAEALLGFRLDKIAFSTLYHFTSLHISPYWVLCDTLQVARLPQIRRRN